MRRQIFVKYSGSEQDEGALGGRGSHLREGVRDDARLLPEPRQHPHRTLPPQHGNLQQLRLRELLLAELARRSGEEGLRYLLEAEGEIVMSILYYVII